jgi:hypothetical protein
VSQLTFAGGVLGLLLAFAYCATALYLKKEPILAVAVNILFSTVGATGAVRLIGFSLTDQFKVATKDPGNGVIWNISPDDGIILWAGAAALAWCSVQTVWQAFKKI